MSELMHVIDGKAITKHDIGCVFTYVGSTHKPVLCKLSELSDLSGDQVYVQFYMPKTLTHTKWSAPTLVYCKELHWYKIPNFTADDLLK